MQRKVIRLDATEKHVYNFHSVAGKMIRDVQFGVETHDWSTL